MPEGVADERGFRLLEHMREDAGADLSLADFKTMVRDQFFMLLLDERRAIEAMPAMLDADPELASRMATTLRKLSRGRLAWKASSARAASPRSTAMFELRKAAKAPKNGAPKESRIEPSRTARVRRGEAAQAHSN